MPALLCPRISSANRLDPYCLFMGLVAFVASTVMSTNGLAEETEQYVMRYKLAKGEVLASRVMHLAKTYTKVNDSENASESRTVSEKTWTITSVDADGNMTFVYQLESVDMSQKNGDRDEVKYRTVDGLEAPPIFSGVAADVGRPLSTVTISPLGKVLSRDEELKTPNLGMGDITIVMPEEPVSVGDRWSVPREFRARLEDGGTKIIKIRELYTLEKVQTGIATLNVRSEPLTPYNDPKIEAQVLQQLSNGEIKFDVDAGRQISKQLSWDENVIGFAGPGSLMEYAARYEEEPSEQPTRTAKSSPATNAK
jgi:hypothetical protein